MQLPQLWSPNRSFYRAVGAVLRGEVGWEKKKTWRQGTAELQGAYMAWSRYDKETWALSVCFSAFPSQAGYIGKTSSFSLLFLSLELFLFKTSINRLIWYWREVWVVLFLFFSYFKLEKIWFSIMSFIGGYWSRSIKNRTKIKTKLPIPVFRHYYMILPTRQCLCVYIYI